MRGPIWIALALLTQWSGAQTWTEVVKITPKPGDVGRSVALDADTAIIGAPKVKTVQGYNGVAHVHERDLGGKGLWGKRTKLVGPGTLNRGGDFGTSVAISGDFVVVGARNQFVTGSLQGAAHVFERDLGGADEWGHAGMLVASDAPDFAHFGSSVGIWGDTVVVGASLDDELGFAAGAVYVYQRDHGGPGAWGEVTKLTASEGGVGDQFGIVAIRDDIVAVGAEGHSGSTGAVYVFERDLGGPNGWGEAARLTASDGVPGDLFSRVALEEGTLVVGAYKHDGPAAESGAAYVFQQGISSAVWTEQMKLLPSTGHLKDWFGATLSLHGGTLAVGTHNIGSADGSVTRFESDPGGPIPWVETQRLTQPGSVSFGQAVATGPFEVVVGDPQAVINGSLAGAAYVYEDRAGTSYCTAGTSASGCQATLEAIGVPSATAATGFFVDASNVEGKSKGLFFFGSNGRQANPWGNSTSFQCVVPPVKRAGILPEVGFAGTCDGSFTQDLNARWCPSCPKPHHNPGVGAVAQVQLWYRDRLSTANQTTSLSDAIEFTVGP